MGGKEKSDKRIRVKPQEKRQIEETGSRGHKRQRMGEVSRVWGKVERQNQGKKTRDNIGGQVEQVNIKRGIVTGRS